MDYDAKSGVFRWKKRTSNRVQVGAVAGTPKDKSGCIYLRISIDGRLYLAHRLAWLYVHGGMPDNVIDHIDGNGMNNAISNLRPCNHSQNAANWVDLSKRNRSGVRGVFWCKSKQRWVAQIKINGKSRHIGTFSDKSAAAQAYKAAAVSQHGEFARC